ncbi:MAG TPA: hypothetical protein VLC47_06735 [Burkholderiales bacterium]|nr:hypothetical protein [Burkholderiales bacterium]
MFTPTFVAAGLVALGCAGPAVARDALPWDADAQFERFDRNWDGFLSRDEIVMAALIAARFDRFDLNRDGRLDHGEFRALHASLKSMLLTSP